MMEQHLYTLLLPEVNRYLAVDQETLHEPVLISIYMYRSHSSAKMVVKSWSSDRER